MSENTGGGQPPIQARERHAALALDLDEHQYRYYVLQSPKVDDIVYDGLMRELEALETEYPGAAHAGLAHPAGRRHILQRVHPGRARRADAQSRQRSQRRGARQPGSSGSSATPADRSVTCAS